MSFFEENQLSGCSSVFPDNNLTMEEYRMYCFIEQPQEKFQLHTNTMCYFFSAE